MIESIYLLLIEKHFNYLEFEVINSFSLSSSILFHKHFKPIEFDGFKMFLESSLL